MTEPRNEVDRPRQEQADKSGYQQHLDDRLDEALKETFPASDPVAVTPRRGEVSAAADQAGGTQT